MPSSLPRQSPWPAIEMQQALQILEEIVGLNLDKLRSIEQKQTNNLKELIGYVLAETLLAFRPVPNFRASVMDGYAIICLYIFLLFLFDLYSLGSERVYIIMRCICTRGLSVLPPPAWFST